MPSGIAFVVNKHSIVLAAQLFIRRTKLDPSPERITVAEIANLAKHNPVPNPLREFINELTRLLMPSGIAFVFNKHSIVLAAQLFMRRS